MEPWFFELRWISFQKGGFFLFVFFSKALLEYKRSVDKRKTMMWVSFKTWVIMMSFVGDGYKQSFWSYARRSLWGENNSRNRTLFSSVGVFQIAWKFTLSTFKKLNVSLLIFSLCCDPLKFFTREKCQSVNNTPWRFKYNSNVSSARIPYNWQRESLYVHIVL